MVEHRQVTKRARWRCAVCAKAFRLEHYMVHDHVWIAAGLQPRDRAHLGCVEARLGRWLRADDFTYAPINNWVHWCAQRFGRPPSEPTIVDWRPATPMPPDGNGNGTMWRRRP